MSAEYGFPASTLTAGSIVPAGMLPVEVAVFNGWFAQHGQEYDAYQWNVRVGGGYDPGPTFDDATRQMAIMNTQKRIDVLAWKGTTPTIIEVKKRGSLGALGQLVGYAHLLQGQLSLPALPARILICNTVDPDLGVPAAALGVTVQAVPVAVQGQ